ncbi:hypothetical protein FISHEDRAFT_56143 [Fistulina hepatica ATCC 64428]|uniref:Uncharacterized protein n=1 Tax=Fistulina hepatica ATCC 64428 TaxID=1128425 RepID=A0A0D7ALH8_9AGAR|nr:hypothetical protein FISHEDRAFT_56143 [Fistulina hepatica ATCC 64428]
MATKILASLLLLFFLAKHALSGAFGDRRLWSVTGACAADSRRHSNFIIKFILNPNAHLNTVSTAEERRELNFRPWSSTASELGAWSLELGVLEKALVICSSIYYKWYSMPCAF